jgi:hypothetical protein
MKTYYQFLEEATKKIRVLRTKHYTTPENQREIIQKGFKDSPLFWNLPSSGEICCIYYTVI